MSSSRGHPVGEIQLTYRRADGDFADTTLKRVVVDDLGAGCRFVSSSSLAQELPVGLVARRLGTSNYHIRYTLELIAPVAAVHVAPRRPRGSSASRPPILTREFFEREYLQAGKTLRQIAAEPGFRHMQTRRSWTFFACPSPITCGVSRHIVRGVG